MKVVFHEWLQKQMEKVVQQYILMTIGKTEFQSMYQIKSRTNFIIQQSTKADFNTQKFIINEVNNYEY